MNLKIPGQYAKFLTVLAGQALVYLQTFGWVWTIKPAATMAAVALAVLAVPNTPKAPAPPPAAPPTIPVSMAPSMTITHPPLSDAELAELKQELAERLAPPPAT